MSSYGVFSCLAESMTSITSFILLDQRSKVDHSKVAVNLDPVLELVVSVTKDGCFVAIL